MVIPFDCPHCGHHTEVDEQYAGQTGPCASCGKTITVPPLSGTPGYNPPKKGSPVLVVVLLVVVVLGLVLFLFAGLFFVAFGAAPRPPRPTAVAAAQTSVPRRPPTPYAGEADHLVGVDPQAGLDAR